MTLALHNMKSNSCVGSQQGTGIPTIVGTPFWWLQAADSSRQPSKVFHELEGTKIKIFKIFCGSNFVQTCLHSSIQDLLLFTIYHYLCSVSAGNRLAANGAQSFLHASVSYFYSNSSIQKANLAVATKKKMVWCFQCIILFLLKVRSLRILDTIYVWGFALTQNAFGKSYIYTLPCHQWMQHIEKYSESCMLPVNQKISKHNPILEML